MSDDQPEPRPRDPFLLNYKPSELRIALEFLSTWAPFLSKDLCQHCTQTLSDRIRSLDLELDSHAEQERTEENSNAENSNSLGMSDDHDDNCDTNSIGSWKDGWNGGSEPVVGPSTSGSPRLETPPSQQKKSWADMEEEEDEFEQEEEEEEDSNTSKRVVDLNAATGELRISKVVVEKPKLPREQREYIRFMNLQRKKDFICLERVKGKIVNILDGLELHTGVFSAVEQKRIVDHVYQLQEMGAKGELKANMVDSVVGSVVTFLLENVNQLLTDEAKLLGGVKDQVWSLQNELNMINRNLQNREGKRDAEGKGTLKEVAYEAEDVIDTFIIKAAMHRKRSKVRKLICLCNQLSTLHGVGKEIERIKNAIKEIKENWSHYSTEVESVADAEAEEILHKRRRTVEKDQVVGFREDTEKLVEQLVGGDSRRRDVISIIGMGGQGKTTLARKIFDNNQVQKHFDVLGWVYVSQKYKTRDLLLEFLKAVKPTSQLKILRDDLHKELFQKLEANYSSNEGKLKDCSLFTHLEEMKEMDDTEFQEMLDKQLKLIKDSKLRDSLQSLVAKIYESNCKDLQDFTDDDLTKGLFRCLTGKRYLLVLDDIWDNTVWDEVRAAFPDKLNRSRILITSRMKEVANYASPHIPPYELPVLNAEESWELFSNKVFQGATCPSQLEELGREIAASCHGLPLAIVVLGGLLARKEKSSHIWKRVTGNVTPYLNQETSNCSDILALSYNYLPRHLKPCFLYFGMYPEDFEISVRQLIQLWIAEGFTQTDSRNVEDVAEEYLEDLINRSLIQVASRRADGGVKTCRIHDLLRDLCIKESVEEKFLDICTKDNVLSISRSRRLSIQCATGLFISSNPCEPSYTRSLFCLGGDETSNDKSNLKRVCEMFKLVRVVDLGNMAICRLNAKKIKKLILVRYLRIQLGVLDVMPASICSLWNLETLDMRKSKINCLPKEFWRLQKLKHLYLGGPTSLPRTNTEALLNLQVLTGIAINQDTESLLAKARFPNLKKLGLHSSSGVEPTLLSNLRPLDRLKTLKINGLFDLSSPISFQLTLSKITLLCMNISPNVVTALGSLPKLEILKIRGVNPVQMDLNCDGSSFPRLEVFKMKNLAIEHWNMERGAMPSLQHLLIDNCEYLVTLPDKLWCLTDLQDVEVLYPSETLAWELRQLQMKMKSGVSLKFILPSAS